MAKQFETKIEITGAVDPSVAKAIGLSIRTRKNQCGLQHYKQTSEAGELGREWVAACFAKNYCRDR